MILQPSLTRQPISLLRQFLSIDRMSDCTITCSHSRKLGARSGLADHAALHRFCSSARSQTTTLG